MGGILARRASGFTIDFEQSAKLTGTEAKNVTAVYKDCQEQLIQDHESMLQLIEDYKGCRELARVAMTTPTRENEIAAFEGLLGAVESIRSFFTYSSNLTEVFPELLVCLCENPLNENPALATQLAKLFDFALQFDQTRMMRPNLSNDFSYYRRLLPKFSKHPKVTVKDDEASGMALFTAEHIPMLSSMTKAADRAEKKLQGAETQGALQHMLATLANSCKTMLVSKKYSDPRSALLCARAMTGSLVLFDLVGPQSAFSKRSQVATRDCILALKTDFPKEFGLINAIKYSTKTFSEAPSSIQDLFD
eukprot:gb/GEZN01008603.1/.p1 GENE.gb/GEZN01008603.1/~~gb/GEZN01008603.1/.p1  ORF type:complete len:306 (-),score=30.33 gb/GEZN01008603.1/:408-1325(-)